MPDSPADLLAIFAEALSRGSEQDRAAYLDEACANDPQARARIESLLRAHREAGNFLGGDSPALAPTLERPAPESLGTRIGPYRLLQQIGEGGMGVVYLAEQTEPVQRRVALKIIKPGMDTRQVVARFEAERQALAVMDHPNIARVFDAGATESGRPYFVMELVNGQPLTAYCDQARLSIAQRLELFVAVCQAVQHAHQKGIIHRDLKPSNILVTLYDGRPVPKVIDFGVAKATGGKLTEPTLATQFGAVVGTLEYMSPEQASFSAVDVDTRADIYSLGIILYELLTGLKPFDSQRLNRAAFDEMLRMIREDEPQRPSTRLSTDKSAPSMAALREIEPRRLAEQLRGELDWIVMKCLEKDRTRRYETAAALGRDLQRFQAQEPVEARPVSTAYRLRKLYHRHRAAFWAGGLVLSSVTAGIVALLIGLIIANNARRSESLRAESEAMQRLRAEQAEQTATAHAASATKESGRAQAAEQVSRRHLYAAQLNLLQMYAHAGNTVRVHDLLNATMPSVKSPDLRGFEWHYWQRQANAHLFKVAKDPGSVRVVAFSADGQRLATAATDGVVKVWNGRTGEELFSWQAHEPSDVHLALTADGARLATTGAGGLKLWDVDAGGKMLQLLTPEFASSLAFSSDGSLLAFGTRGGGVGMRDAKSGKAKTTWIAHKDERPMSNAHAVNGIAFSPDGTRLATCSAHREVRLWDAATGKQLWAAQGPATAAWTNAAFSVVYSPQGDRVAAGFANGAVVAWSAEDGRELFKCSANDRPVLAVAYSLDGHLLASGGYDGVVRVWNAANGESQRQLLGHTGWVRSLSFGPGGRLASGGPDRQVKVWDANLGTSVLAIKQPDKSIHHVAYSPDGAHLAVAASRLRMLDAASGKLLWESSGRNEFIITAAFSPDGTKVVTGDMNGKLRIWNANTGDELLAWVIAPRIVVRNATAFIHCACFTPDGLRVVATNCTNAVKVYDAATGAELLRTEPLSRNVSCMAISRDGRQVAGSSEAVALTTWHADTGKVRRSLVQDQNSYPNGLAFSPDGRRLARGEGSAVRIWDTDTGEELLKLQGHSGTVTNVAYSDDGERIASSSVHQIKVWDAITGQELLSLDGDLSTVSSVDFHPRQPFLASGGPDGTVRIWGRLARGSQSD